MKYLRVKPEFDQKPTNPSILVANELYTLKEYEKINKRNGGHIPLSCFEEVEISKKDTCFFFGARFNFPKSDKQLEELGYFIERTATGHPSNKYAIWFRGIFVCSCGDTKEANKLARQHNKNRI